MYDLMYLEKMIAEKKDAEVEKLDAEVEKLDDPSGGKRKTRRKRKSKKSKKSRKARKTRRKSIRRHGRRH